MGAGAAFAAIAVFAALPTSAAAAEAPAQPPPEPSIAIVEFPAGAPVIGLPARCPGEPATPEEDEEAGGEVICLAGLYQGRVLVNRHLSGPRIPPGTRVRLTAHARHWRRGQRLLVALIPFRDGKVSGLFAYYWATPLDASLYCASVADLARWGDNPVSRVYAAGVRQRFRPRRWDERTDFRCIREWRKPFPR